MRPCCAVVGGEEIGQLVVVAAVALEGRLQRIKRSSSSQYCAYSALSLAGLGRLLAGLRRVGGEGGGGRGGERQGNGEGERTQAAWRFPGERKAKHGRRFRGRPGPEVTE